jgi:hypothetical protein
LSPAFLIPTALALVDDASAPHEATNPATGVAVSLTAGWSATFVHRAGYWSHFDYRLEASIWPLPATSSCDELAAFATDNFVLADDEPNPGDIYLLWSPAKKLFVRAGIILGHTRRQVYPSGRAGYECLTVDADTTVRGSLRGPSTAIIRRMLSPDAGDRWIRWPLLDRGVWEQPSFAEPPRRRAA